MTTPLADAKKQINEQNQLAWELRNSQAQKALQISQTIYKESAKLGYELGKAASKQTSAYCENLLGGHAKALLDCEESQQIYKRLNHTEGLFNVHNILGQIYWEISDYPKAIGHIIQMVEFAEGTVKEVMAGVEDGFKIVRNGKSNIKTYLNDPSGEEAVVVRGITGDDHGQVFILAENEQTGGLRVAE